MELCVTHVVKPGSHWDLGRWMRGREGGGGSGHTMSTQKPLTCSFQTLLTALTANHIYVCNESLTKWYLTLLFAKHSNVFCSILFFKNPN